MLPLWLHALWTVPRVICAIQNDNYSKFPDETVPWQAKAFFLPEQEVSGRRGWMYVSTEWGAICLSSMSPHAMESSVDTCISHRILNAEHNLASCAWYTPEGTSRWHCESKRLSRTWLIPACKHLILSGRYLIMVKRQTTHFEAQVIFDALVVGLNILAVNLQLCQKKWSLSKPLRIPLFYGAYSASTGKRSEVMKKGNACRRLLRFQYPNSAIYCTSAANEGENFEHCQRCMFFLTV